MAQQVVPPAKVEKEKETKPRTNSVGSLDLSKVTLPLPGSTTSDTSSCSQPQQEQPQQPQHQQPLSPDSQFATGTTLSASVSADCIGVEEEVEMEESPVGRRVTASSVPSTPKVAKTAKRKQAPKLITDWRCLTKDYSDAQKMSAISKSAPLFTHKPPSPSGSPSSGIPSSPLSSSSYRPISPHHAEVVQSGESLSPPRSPSAPRKYSAPAAYERSKIP